MVYEECGNGTFNRKGDDTVAVTCKITSEVCVANIDENGQQSVTYFPAIANRCPVYNSLDVSADLKSHIDYVNLVTEKSQLEQRLEQVNTDLADSGISDLIRK